MLPAYVLVFVLDLTDTATVSHSDQLELRAHVREQSQAVVTQGWIDVVVKAICNLLKLLVAAYETY